MCDRARSSLGLLRGRPQVVVADSRFNADEAEEAGLGPATVVPLLLDLPDAPDAPRPPSTEPTILYVGRLAPNKRVEDVIRAFALLQRWRAPEARPPAEAERAGWLRRSPRDRIGSSPGAP